MNTDKLMSDAFNNRASTLDISSEKFEEMLQFIEMEAEVREAKGWSRFLDKLKNFKLHFPTKQLVQISLAILIIFSIPLAIKNIGLPGLAKKSAESSPTENKSETAYDLNESITSGSTEQEAPKSEEAQLEDSETNTKGSENQKVVVTFTEEKSSEYNLTLLGVEDVKRVVSTLKLAGAKSITINNIFITDATIIENSTDSNSILINDISISLKETIKVEAIGNKDRLNKALADIK